MAAAARATSVHLACVAGLVAGWWIALQFYSSSIVSEPLRVLGLLVVILAEQRSPELLCFLQFLISVLFSALSFQIVELPVVIIAYSSVRSDKDRTSVSLRPCL